MSSPQPINTSTPTVVPRVKGRHSYKTSVIFSPIETMKNKVEAIDGQETEDSICTPDDNDKQNLKTPGSARHTQKENSPSMTDDSSDTCNSDKCNKRNFTQLDDKSEKEIHQLKDNTKRSTDKRSAESSTANMYKYQYGIAIIIFGIIITVVLGLKGNEDVPLPTVTINTLKESFPQQDDEFWSFIKSGVMEINNFEKPTVIILMHKKSVTGITELLKNITTYASCVVNENCFVDPIILQGQDLNTPELIEDYGILIDDYRSLLEEKRILVVNNIEEVLGSVAQAFHYFCDEYTPLVKKSLIIFTIQVNEYKGKELEQAVNILNRRWKDIEPDKLQPLITRVSSIVLRIK